MIEIISTVALLTASPQAWAVGVEREVDQGVYMKIVAANQGWRVWRIETRRGVDCRAYKSAQGRSHPVPAGAGSLMARRGTPFIELYYSDPTQKFYTEWHTVHFRGRGKYRKPGDRFWEEDSIDPNTIEEGIVEVHVSSWEYPEILVGYAEETARLDLTGLRWSLNAISACMDNK